MCWGFPGCLGILFHIGNRHLHAAVPDIRDLDPVAHAPMIDPVVADREGPNAFDLQSICLVAGIWEFPQLDNLSRPSG